MKVDVALRTSASIAIRHFDAYFNMAPTNAGANDPRQEKIRRDYFDYCGIASGITDKPGSSSSGSEIVNEPNPARCVLTSQGGKLAHLAPASAKVGRQLFCAAGSRHRESFPPDKIDFLLSFEPHPSAPVEYLPYPLIKILEYGTPAERNDLEVVLNEAQTI